MINNVKILILPVLPLRDIVIYPEMIIQLFIKDYFYLKSINYAMKTNKKILMLTQKEGINILNNTKDLYNIGTISTIIEIIKMPDLNHKVIIKGLLRAKVLGYLENYKNKYILAKVTYKYEKQNDCIKKNIYLRTLMNQFEIYIKLYKKISYEFYLKLLNINNINKIVYIIIAQIPLKVSIKQLILEENNIYERCEYLIKIIYSEIEFLRIEESIINKVKQQIDTNKKEEFLNEQLKIIKRELYSLSDIMDEYEYLAKQIERAGMPEEVKIKTEIELQKLRKMNSMSSEATVIRTYIDWMLSIPWYKSTLIQNDLNYAKYYLSKYSYGLSNVKDRILEYLAVQNRNKNIRLKGPILCLVGPPGVGKTSLGKAIAKATGRIYVRMALGGIKDEGEIRGHRRTYIGSMPGKIIQKLSQVGVKNPLFLLDEIDKMSFDLHNDPASALLEVLDPEQNKAFNDHYLEVDYDLSEVMFIATSNSLNIPAPLLDRMEIINIPGYTDYEKLQIARKHLLKKQIYLNSLKSHEFSLDRNVLIKIIRNYTREAGVRNLERQLAKLCRKIVKELVLNYKKHININIYNLNKFLGVELYDYGVNYNNVNNNVNNIGQVIGLAWTEVGGDLINIETVCLAGKGKLILTGSLGEVMQESIQAALTVVRANTQIININSNFLEFTDIHIHVPEGAIPKDGPSAGIAMCTAIISSLTKNPVKNNLAMTGEITLRGEVLSIGGLKEKLLAAHRSGIKKVIIPYKNFRDLENIPKILINNLEIYPVKNIYEILLIAFQNKFK